VEGTISPHVTSKGWGFDPIFIPSGHKRTYGEIGQDKIEISHRTMALKEFIGWYKGFSTSQNRI
ncbi:MAG TPA: non-canonical purine NTP pyrophosphatase, partial [Nitrososphaeraceae archaeon]